MRFVLPYKSSNAALTLFATVLSVALLFVALLNPSHIGAQTPPQQEHTSTPWPTPTSPPPNPGGTKSEQGFVFVDPIKAFRDELETIVESDSTISDRDEHSQMAAGLSPSTTDAEADWTFPDDMPEAIRQAYRALYADIHSFSDRQYGFSVDFTPEIIVGPIGACGIVSLPTMWLNPQCSDDSGLPREVMAHEYLHLVQSWPRGTLNWMWEGSAEYFSYRYLDDAGIRDYSTSRSIDIERVIRWSAPDLEYLTRNHRAFYPLSFLAMDYLAQVSHANAPVDYFNSQKRSGGDWYSEFNSIFGIQVATFYQRFAEYRATIGISVPEATPPRPDLCSNGIAVPDPGNNAGLVRDCVTLLSVMNALRGDAYLDWSADASIHGWGGITVGGLPLRVTWLVLNDLNVNGSIPTDLSNLSNMEVLSLRGNNLTGTIPSELSSLSNLTALSLGRNSLTGAIPPELGSLSKLEMLRLDNNQLSGTVPAELGSLSNLITLLINNNRLSGDIPSELGNLDTLTFLGLAGNQFTGCIPEALSDVEDNDLNQLDLPFCDAGTPTPTSEPMPEPAPTPTQEPSPTPSPTPTATPEPPVDNCVRTVSGNGTFSGSWDSDCASEGRSGSYASYYTFTLAESADVTITAESSADTYLFLREGAGRDGSVVAENDDIVSGNTNSQIQQMLHAGTYSIEVTTYSEGETGEFTMTISGLPAVGPRPTKTIAFGDLNWPSATLQTRIAQYIAEMGYGYSSNAVSGASLPLFNGLRNGDIDVLMELWLPNQEEAWEEALAEETVSSPGSSLGADWQSAFVIPKYLQEQYPDLDSVEDLKEDQYRSLFATAESNGKARLVSCVIGWACEVINAAQIEGYGLDEHIQIVNPGDGSALNADLTEAYENGEPWLGYQRGTNETALLLDLVRLEEPAYSDECWETTMACAYEDSAVLIAVNAGLTESAADFVDVLTEWDFNVDGVYKPIVRWQGDNPDANTEDAALWWLRGNNELWSEWLTADADAAIRDALNRNEIPDGWPEEPNITPEPTPTPSPTPEPPSDSCVGTVNGNGAITGSWESDCASEGRSGSYASYYTFTLTESADVTITAESSVDTYLYLRQEAGRDGSVLQENDDIVSGNTNSQIVETLAAGTYTIEATTYNAGVTGDFTLTVSGLPAAVEPTPTPVPTPSPSPVPTPTPEPPADSCIETVNGNGATSDNWSSDCASEGRSGSYASFYTFTLTESADVTITAESSVDTYLFLREGDGRDGSVVDENDDHDSSEFSLDSTTDSGISESLDAGTYTIEVTTYTTGETGDFTLTIGGLPAAVTPTPEPSPTPGPSPEPTPTPTPEPAPDPEPPATSTSDCSNGVAVSDRDANSGLVSDCEILLGARDTLAGTAALNWSADVSMATWQGIEIDGNPLRVLELELEPTLHTQGPAVTGSIPPELGGLTKLTSIRVSNPDSVCFVDDCRDVEDHELNQLTGSIPRELGNLRELYKLSLFGNNLSGEIPSELGSLSELESLLLSDNSLSGGIPVELGSLAALRQLWLDENQLSGSIPAELGNLDNLEDLSLFGNQLSGSIPAELEDLDNLELLYIGENQFSGCVPAGLADVSDNDIFTLGLPYCSAGN